MRRTGFFCFEFSGENQAYSATVSYTHLYFEMEKEENPALGCRAIRICLTRPEIFKTQLRALFRASAYGKIAIMYPMITSVGEVRQIKAIVELSLIHICKTSDLRVLYRRILPEIQCPCDGSSVFRWYLHGCPDGDADAGNFIPGGSRSVCHGASKLPHAGGKKCRTAFVG